MEHHPRNVLVTGGAGFIGCNFVRHLLATEPDARIVTLDLLTYAGSLDNLRELPDPARHRFVQGDICDRPLVDRLLREHAIDNEWANINIAKLICALLDQRRPEHAPHERLISFVADRPGHDWRYAIDPRKMSEALSWRPEETFNTGIAKTVDWYLERHATDPAWGGMTGE